MNRKLLNKLLFHRNIAVVDEHFRSQRRSACETRKNRDALIPVRFFSTRKTYARPQNKCSLSTREKCDIRTGNRSARAPPILFRISLLHRRQWKQLEQREALKRRQRYMSTGCCGVVCQAVGGNGKLWHLFYAERVRRNFISRPRRIRQRNETRLRQ